MDGLLKGLMKAWGRIAPPTFSGVELPRLDDGALGKVGIDASRDMQVMRWFEREHGPVSWDPNGKFGILARGDDWAFAAGKYLANALSVTEHERQFDIRNLTGFSASRSNLHVFDSIEAMHRGCGRPTPKSLDDASALVNQVVVDHRGHLDIYHLPQHDRYWFSNYGGSHRMAAAVTVARQLGVAILVPATIKRYELNIEAIECETREFGAFVVAPGAYLNHVRLQAGEGERFTLVKPFLGQPWPPTLMLTERPLGRIPGTLGRMVDVMLKEGAAQPLSAFLRSQVPTLKHEAETIPMAGP